MRLDALAIANDGTLINYEMQNERMHGMKQRMRMCESSINLSFLAKGDDYGNLPDIHDFDCWDYRTMKAEVMRSEMKYFKTTKEGAMGYGGDIDG